MCRCLFLFKHREEKKHNKTTKKIPRERKELTFKFPLCPFTFGFHFCPPTFALPFQVFSLGIFFFLSKKKKHKEEKTIEKKKYADKGRSLPSSSHSALSLLASASTFLLLHFHFKRFFLASSSYQIEDKTKSHKKTHKEEKNAEKGRSLPSSSHSTLSFLAPASTFLLLPFHFKCFLLASSSSQTEETKNTKKKKP